MSLPTALYWSLITIVCLTIIGTAMVGQVGEAISLAAMLLE